MEWPTVLQVICFPFIVLTIVENVLNKSFSSWWDLYVQIFCAVGCLRVHCSLICTSCRPYIWLI